ncbi:MAG TPA: bifunctional riboflavin kinase/FAD synthetase [Anaerolineae bacterium]|nr:bifunctional riboflavin kinase/FAD synthetase [Anaerolineae bacterium]
MRLIHNLEDTQLAEETVVTIGSFDGVHRGHLSLIADVRAAALAANRAAVVITFFPHPSVVLGRAQPFYLTSPEEKLVQINQTGVDLLIELPFTSETALMRAGEFVDQLVAQLRMRELWIGHDFALGYKREGDAEFLARLGETRGFTVRSVNPVTNGGEVISSSAIRAALKQGEVAHAARLLGRRFRVSGRVVPGDGRGRTIGIPTANMDVWTEHAVPANGVYACRAWVGHIAHAAAVNIGTRPTVTDQTQRTIEAHLLDFDRDLYGINVALDFVERLRSEQKFANVEALVTQIQTDVQRTRELITHDVLRVT